MWERAAGYTPTAMVAEFQHGLVRLDVVLVALSLIAGRARAGGDLDRGSASPVRRARLESVAVAALHGRGALRCARSSRRAGTRPRTGRTRSRAPTKRRSRQHSRAAAHRGASRARGSAAGRPRAPRAVEAAARDAALQVSYVVGDLDRPVRADRRRTTARSGTSSAADAR